MAAREQIELFGGFETAKPPSPLFCHQEFLEKVAAHERDGIARRATLLMQRLTVDARRQHYKPTQGENRGWRRSRLGGNHGSHFYAWWAPKDAFPFQAAEGFENAPGGAMILRDIRHHDDHSALTPQSLASHYLPVTVRELRREEYAPAPWTTQQSRFASARQAVRILKGHPGSGKTTSLWHAADSAPGSRVLYATFSRDLAGMARDYFDRFCSSHKHFHVVTFPTLIRELLGEDAPLAPERESRRIFERDLAPIARGLGAWSNSAAALYDELHAHLCGDALPVAAGRFTASKQPRVSDASYRERRNRSLGESAATSALEAAARLERMEGGSFAERYCPELALAWRAAEKLCGPPGKLKPHLVDFDCIAVDECQDLTPLEAFVIVRLAAAIQRERPAGVQLLLAGDEAQTVRPADFEWGWMNDILHSMVGTPAEHKLAANLRSPRRIAELVNRVWDLYSHLQKHERPSGTGYADIDDDATDQILYCTAAPGPALDELLIALAAREGLAMIAFEDGVPAFVPEAARSALLTVSEAKGLDFDSVCVLDAGRHIERITRESGRLRAGAEIEGLRKRLAIDQLRVALSRPTERLIWLDISPPDHVVRRSIEFLNGGDAEAGVSSCVPSALLKTIEEDQLDVEERVQRCQADARQYLNVKPEMAWSRAQQAVTLLGRLGSQAAVTDPAARSAAHMTLAEVCFCLGFRKVNLPPELGRPDLFREAAGAAAHARRPGLAEILNAVASALRASSQERLPELARMAQAIALHKSQLEPWLLLEMAPRTPGWMDELEQGMFNGNNAAALLQILPPFYETLGVADRQARVERLRQRAIQLLIKDKRYRQALDVLHGMAEAQPKLEAACHEGLGDFRAAAECHRRAGNLKEAMQCYRSIPDLDAALGLLPEMKDHPAAETLEWMGRLRTLVAERPEKFTKLATAAEKKLLEELLERSLGVTRKKPAVKKSAAPRKRAPRKAAPRTP